MTVAEVVGALDEAQRSTFRREGYLLLEKCFSADEVEELRHDTSRILELLINSSLANGRTSRRLDVRQPAPGRMTVRKIQPVRDLSLVLTRLARDPRLLQPMRQIFDDEPSLMEEKVNYKLHLDEPLPGLDARQADDRFLIHSDWQYHRAQGYPPTLNAAVCLDDCTPDSGPLHVWPGTHLEEVEHERVGGSWQVPASRIDVDGGVDLLCQAGTLILFHSMLLHNSRPNQRREPRRLVIFSYFPADAAPQLGEDARNGPMRLQESPFEWRYVERRQSGHFDDVFRFPRF